MRERKQILSLTVETRVINKIESIAHVNGITKSEVGRKIMDVVFAIPPEAFHKKSSVLDVMGLEELTENED